MINVHILRAWSLLCVALAGSLLLSGCEQKGLPSWLEPLAGLFAAKKQQQGPGPQRPA
ncbi:hypothetical protein H206_03856, partial [Candidatus Electrothrix aarhusensis]